MEHRLHPAPAVHFSRTLGFLLIGAAVALAGCRAVSMGDAQAAPPRGPVPAQARTEIHATPKLTSIEHSRTDALGRPLRIACATCHSLRLDAKVPEATSELDEFHRGLQFEHGRLRCASCHVDGRVDRVRLADGALLPMQDALELCAQCHGPQTRDYRRGSHGGMTGEWAGLRTKNHCVDCHDPHLPRFQPSIPVLPPRDRGVVSGQARAGGGHD